MTGGGRAEQGGVCFQKELLPVYARRTKVGNRVLGVYMDVDNDKIGRDDRGIEEVWYAGGY